MVSSKVGTVVIVITALGALALVIGLTEHVEASDVHYNETVILRNDTIISNCTWYVEGKIIVDSCTLVLDNASIQFIGYKGTTLSIGDDARLECRNSQISGDKNFSRIAFAGQVSIFNSTIGTYPRDNSTRYIQMWINSEVHLENSTIVNWRLFCVEKLTVENCYWDSPVGIQSGHYNELSWNIPYTIRVYNSTFNNVGGFLGSISGYGGGGMIIHVRGCDFIGGSSGVRIYEFYNAGTAIVEENLIAGGDYGIILDGVGSAVVIRNNTINSRIGLYGNVTGPGVPFVDGLTIEAASKGVFVEDSILPLYLTNCSISCDERAIVAFNGSVVLTECNITSTKMDFFVTSGGSVDLVDCEHGVEYLQVDGQIRAATRFPGNPFFWKEGPKIVEGLTYIQDVRGADLGPVDNNATGALNLTYWLVNLDTRSIIDQVVAVIYDTGTAFRSHVFSPRNLTEPRVDIIDDWTPQIIFSSHTDNEHLNTYTFTVAGHFDERGSGTDYAWLRCGDGPWMDVNASEGPGFILNFTVADDGLYLFRVDAMDRAGNNLDGIVLRLVIDTVPPLIVVITPGRYVNENKFILEVETEPGAIAWIIDEPALVDAAGRFSSEIHHPGGVIAINIRTMDQAGNVNVTNYSVELDENPPMLIIEYPIEGDWIDAIPITVRGICEEDAIVTVNMMEVTRNGTAFSYLLDSPNGQITIQITAVDLAGNVVHSYIEVRVDTIYPSVIVDTPGPDKVVNEEVIIMTGRASDNNHVDIFVDGNPTWVTNGKWRYEIPVKDGVNLVDIKATDLAGNTVFIQWSILCDLTSPNLDLELTLNGLLLKENELTRTRHTVVSVRVLSDEACILTVDGHGDWDTPEGLSFLNLSLTPQSKNKLVFTAKDRAGNEVNEIVFRIEVDTVPPYLEVHPLTDSKDHAPGLVTLRGTTERGAILTLNGIQLEVEANGSFEGVVKLVEGMNEFVVVTIDDVGNEANVTARVMAEASKDPDEVDTNWVIYTSVIAGVLITLALALLARNDWGRKPIR